jgi:transglutaminase-like putative cysteine protease
MRKLLYDITHRTTYNYDGDVSVSHHLLRLTPRHYAKQNRLSHELAVTPSPAVISAHRDYFGNPTHFIAVESSHKQLVVESRGRVAVGPIFVPDPAETPAWEAVRARCRDDHSGESLEAHEFTYASPLIPDTEELSGYARDSFTASRPVLDAVLDLTRRIHEDFSFDPASTTVSTPVSQVFRQRRGVCQDFVHFEISCLRSLGLPARYMSGYLETDPPPGQPKLRGVDASHAWVSFFCPGVGWIEVDPTNNCVPSMRHVTLGWGRDYSDIAPIRGVLVGGEKQQLLVAVDVVAVGPMDEKGRVETEDAIQE